MVNRVAVAFERQVLVEDFETNGHLAHCGFVLLQHRAQFAGELFVARKRIGVERGLFCRHLCGIVVTDLCQRLAESVGRLVDLATILIGGKEIIHRHGGSIIQTTDHDRLTVQVGFQVAVLHPEQRIGRALTVGIIADNEVIATHHHRTEGQHLDMERRISLIVVGALLQIEFLHFSRRNVTIVNLQLTVRLLIEDMIIVEHGLHLNLR